MKVIYLSAEPETALREANAHFRYRRLPLEKGFSKVVVAVRVELDRVLDLRRRRSLPEPMKSLLAEDWRAIMALGQESATQALGRAADAAGIAGLLVPSKPDPKGINLVVFPERLSEGNSLTILNAEVLDTLGRPG